MHISALAIKRLLRGGAARGFWFGIAIRSDHSTSREASLYGPAQQQVAQDNGIIMKLVMGREHEGYRTLTCPLP